MQYRLAALAVFTGLLVTGCSGGSSDNGAQLADYELCLENARIDIASKDKTTLYWKGLISEGGQFYDDEKGRACYFCLCN